MHSLRTESHNLCAMAKSVGALLRHFRTLNLDRDRKQRTRDYNYFNFCKQRFITACKKSTTCLVTRLFTQTSAARSTTLTVTVLLND